MIALVHIDGDDVPVRFQINASYGPGIGPRIEILEPDLPEEMVRRVRRELMEELR